jgi:cell division inhibitor SepF
MSQFFRKTLSFLGLAEEDSNEYGNKEYDDDNLDREKFGDFAERRDIPERRYRIGYHKDEPTRKNMSNLKPARKLLSLDSSRDMKKSRVSVEEPHEFEEVQMIGDDFKENIPVIINLQNINQDLSKRIIDFCSGLTYALGGSIKKVADRVFLITPQNMIVTSNEKEILREKGLYNQL